MGVREEEESRGLSEVERLIARLDSGTAIEREAAIARLRVLGARALERVARLITSADSSPAARAAALRALEGSAARSAQAVALTALRDDNETVALAAIGVLRGCLAADQGVAVLDALSAVALDRDRPSGVRFAALDAVSQLPRDIVQPLAALMEGGSSDGAAVEAGDGEPSAAREWLAAQPKAPLSLVHDLIVYSREQERREKAAGRKQDWLVTRGAAHALLARRGSRVALYDLREAFDAAATPLPLDFLTAVAAIGDADTLEALARSWTAAPNEAWWRTRILEAARDIINRTRLTGRSAALKRVRSKYPGFL